MQVASNARRLSRVLRAPSLLSSDRFLPPDVRIIEPPHTSPHGQWRNHTTFSLQTLSSSATNQRCTCLDGCFCNKNIHGNCLNYRQHMGQHSMCSVVMTMKASYSSAAAIAVEGSPTEAVKELYDKMLQSVKAQTMPPNAWLWSLIENCKNHDDIKLLFDILQNLRRFRLSNLRIHSNFNCNLCQEITKACVRVGAIDFGKKAIWKHNVYGLSPSIASAHHLLLYAKEHKDTLLMEEVMKILKRNDLPLQPGTADIVFSICYNTDNWQLISKYSKKFVKAGVKLRKTTLDIWMEFAAKIGDIESLWKIEKLRSESMKKHTLASAFSCAKGFLLERQPENAAAVIQALNQAGEKSFTQELSDAKRPDIMVELQKLVSKWPLEVIKHQKEEDRKALATSLKIDIPIMVSGLLNKGIEVSVNMEDLTQEGIHC